MKNCTSLFSSLSQLSFSPSHFYTHTHVFVSNSNMGSTPSLTPDSPLSEADARLELSVAIGKALQRRRTERIPEERRQ